MEEMIMGRMISKQTYDSPAEGAETRTRAIFEIRVKFRLFDAEARDWAFDTIKAIEDEWDWCLQRHAEAVKVEQIPILSGDTITHRMMVVSLNFDTGWVNSYDIGEWWGEYIEDPQLWEGEYPEYEKAEFGRLLEKEARGMAEDSEDLEVRVISIAVREDR